MTKAEMVALVAGKLQSENTQHVEDIVLMAAEYCNLEDDLPEGMEPIIRKKVKQILDYEANFGSDVAVDVKSVKSGDTSWTYNTDNGSARDVVYGFSKKELSDLARYRRLRR